MQGTVRPQRERRNWLLAVARLAAVMAVGGAVAFWTTGGAPAEGEQRRSLTPASSVPTESASCLDCHRDPDLSMVLPSGEKLGLFVDEGETAISVHRGKLGCTDCHRRIDGFPHRRSAANSKRDYSVTQYETCKRCHFANYTQTLDSIHYQVMSAGDSRAPLCTDCHGYHVVTEPSQPRPQISQNCGRCHQDSYESYSRGAHGAALVREENGDVPRCTDCHGTHSIKDPDTPTFRLNSPEMCAECHTDEGLMRRYGLSSNVFRSYLQDFHGATTALAKRENPDSQTPTAVCSDCHGVHDIKSTKGSSREEIKKNAVAACQKCHPDAGTHFPEAWLSHYELSWEKAPLPWLVRAAYTVLIPLMVGGLMLHIVVDLWRMARNR